MKILIIDDMDFRHEGFSRFYSNDTLDHAWNSKEAKEKLSSNTYDLICFDHDLGERYENGASIARWMVEEGLKCKEIRVHSSNFEGAKNIVSIIKSGSVSDNVYIHEFSPKYFSYTRDQDEMRMDAQDMLQDMNEIEE